ncbi:MAG: hypothetical protein WCY41_03470 [Candidatus Micrarchaeia archaeon]
MAVDAVFHFIASNPATALICGGILLLVANPVTKAISPAMDYSGLGVLLLGLGVVLHLLWMFKDRI